MDKTKTELIIVILCAMFFCGSVLAAKPFPSGIYHSAKSLDENSINTLISEEINTLPHISGTLVRIPQSAIHIGPGDFNFELLDAEFAKADLYNTSILLGVQDSFALPDFVLAECEAFEYYSIRSGMLTTCLPGDPVYLQYKAEMLAALGERYDSHPRLLGIYTTYSAMKNGYEMHFDINSVELALFEAHGYDELGLINAYQNVISLYIDHFPETPKIIEVHTVLDSPLLANNAWFYCFLNGNGRWGVAAWWCSQKNAEGVEALMMPLLENASRYAFTVCQTVNNFTDNPDIFDLPGMPSRTSEEALEQDLEYWRSILVVDGVEYGVKVTEGWTKDVKNESFFQIYSDHLNQLE